MLDRTFFEGVLPIVKRTFNILKRKGLFPPLPEEYADLDLAVEMELTGILAMAMKAKAASPTIDFLQIIGGISQYKQDILDVPDFDAMAYDLADVKGVNPSLLNSMEEISKVRKQRQAMEMQKEAEAKGIQSAMLKEELNSMKAGTAKSMSEANANLSDSINESGGLL
jgi:hypothetical protein